jgi:hypothetical protein
VKVPCGIDAEAAWIQTILCAEYLHQLPLVEDAFGHQALALLAALNTACTNAEDLAAHHRTFCQTPGRRDHHQPARTRIPHRRPSPRRDRQRPIPLHQRQSPQGLRRKRTRDPSQRQKPHRDPLPSQEQRLAAVGYVWAFPALTASPGARTHYDRRKTTGDRHTPPNATCSIDSSTVCTTACKPDSTTTNRSHSPPPTLSAIKLFPQLPLKSVPWATRYESSTGRRSRFTEVGSRRVVRLRSWRPVHGGAAAAASGHLALDFCGWYPPHQGSTLISWTSAAVRVDSVAHGRDRG